MPNKGEVLFTDRHHLLEFARRGIQKHFKDESPEHWLGMCQGYVAAVNETLDEYKWENTDLEHLLPLATNDPSLITYRQVMEAAHV